MEGVVRSTGTFASRDLSRSCYHPADDGNSAVWFSLCDQRSVACGAESAYSETDRPSRNRLSIGLSTC